MTPTSWLGLVLVLMGGRALVMLGLFYLWRWLMLRRQERAAALLRRIQRNAYNRQLAERWAENTYRRSLREREHALPNAPANDAIAAAMLLDELHGRVADPPEAA